MCPSPAAWAGAIPDTDLFRESLLLLPTPQAGKTDSVPEIVCFPFCLRPERLRDTPQAWPERLGPAQQAHQSGNVEGAGLLLHGRDVPVLQGTRLLE